jgi:hypothetical protein
MDKICVYNTKEQNKIGKLLLNTETDKSNYKISYSNKFLIEYNKDYVFIICEKSDIYYPKKSLLDLINFQDIRTEFLRNKPNKPITDFFNIMQIDSNPKPKPIEEDNKILTSSNLNEDMKNEKEEEKKKDKKDDKNKKGKKEEKKDDKNKKNDKDKNKKKGKEETEEEESKENIPEPITKIELNDRVIVIYRIRDILFKCYPNLAYNHKKGMSLRKIMKQYRYYEYPTFSPAEVKKEGMMSIKYLSSDLKKRNSSEQGNTNLKKDLIGINNANEDEKSKKIKQGIIDKHNSTQRKDIFYNSFKNIKERHHHKEERINAIEKQKKKITKELKEQNANKKKTVTGKKYY